MPDAAFPLHGEFRNRWILGLFSQDFENYVFLEPEIDAAFGRATSMSLYLQHALTDFAIAITEEDPSKIHMATNGGLKKMVLKAASRQPFAEVGRHLDLWDCVIGAEAVAFRNHLSHSRIWVESGVQFFGREANGVYAAWTLERLRYAGSIQMFATQWLSQIFWDSLLANHRRLIRSSSGHQFMLRNAPFENLSTPRRIFGAHAKRITTEGSAA